MLEILVVGGVLTGVLSLGALVMHFLLKLSREAGKLEERNAETQRQNAAKARADEVLAEHRDPSSVDERLRRGDF